MGHTLVIFLISFLTICTGTNITSCTPGGTCNCADGEACDVACTATSCEQTTINVNAASSISFTCTGTKACDQITINGPTTNIPFTLICNGDEACREGTINAGNASSFDVYCRTTSSCRDCVMNCGTGTGSCTIHCESSAACQDMDMDCGSASECILFCNYGAAAMCKNLKGFDCGVSICSIVCDDSGTGCDQNDANIMDTSTAISFECTGNACHSVYINAFKSVAPTIIPTKNPSKNPTLFPSNIPTNIPSSFAPTYIPTSSPTTSIPTTYIPTFGTTHMPTYDPTSLYPTISPSGSPTSSYPTLTPVTMQPITVSPTSSYPTLNPVTMEPITHNPITLIATTKQRTTYNPTKQSITSDTDNTNDANSILWGSNIHLILIGIIVIICTSMCCLIGIYVIFQYHRSATLSALGAEYDRKINELEMYEFENRLAAPIPMKQKVLSVPTVLQNPIQDEKPIKETENSTDCSSSDELLSTKTSSSGSEENLAVADVIHVQNADNNDDANKAPENMENNLGSQIFFHGCQHQRYPSSVTLPTIPSISGSSSRTHVHIKSDT